ncbi:MAG: transposase, partial [Bacteroidota bacterium]
GAILTQGVRTICGILRTLGLSQITNWDLYHRVLSRAKWSALACAKQMLQLLIKTFIDSDVLVFGMDETLERRWGPRIKARGIYRDAVRSSKSHFIDSIKEYPSPLCKIIKNQSFLIGIILPISSNYQLFPLVLHLGN